MIRSPLSSAIRSAVRSPLRPPFGLSQGVTRAQVIAALFGASEQGAMYDPSDLSTLFQDSAGITPVTTFAQPFGLMLDVSKGLKLGPELVTNGTFDSVITGWSTVSPATREWVDGRQFITVAGGNFGGTGQNISTVTGRSYLVEFDYELGTSSFIRGYVSGTHQRTMSAASGKLSFIAVASGVSMSLRIDSGPNEGSFYIDNVTVKELKGNHATQDTASLRPLSTNGRLRSDGSDDQMDFPSVTARFIAVACQRITDGPWSAGYVVGGASRGIANGGTNASFDDVFVTDGTNIIASGVDGTDALVITVNIIGSSGTLRVNGVEFTGTLNPIIVSRLFNRTDGSFRFHGDNMGTVIRDTAATTAQVQLVEQYLAEKAGVTLP